MVHFNLKSKLHWFDLLYSLLARFFGSQCSYMTTDFDRYSTTFVGSDKKKADRQLGLYLSRNKRDAWMKKDRLRTYHVTLP